MTKVNDPHDADFRATLPADLQSLDSELSGIRIEERPSFGPELRGELAQAWQARKGRGSRAPRRWVRNLMAAGIAGIMIAGVSVPQARAAVFGFVQTMVEEVLPNLFTPEPEIQLPDIQVQEPDPVPSEAGNERVVSPVDASEEVETPMPELQALPNVEFTYPEIISRQEAAAILAAHYPPELQREGIEGSVRLWFWVDVNGKPEGNIQLRESSGNQQLDYEAMLAAREFRFRPATRNGVAVGTLVEVDVHFFALTGVGIIGSDTAGTRG